MQRRSLLSRLGGGLAVATSTGLAGCSGDESADTAPSETVTTDTGTAADASPGSTPNESPSDGTMGGSGVSGEIVESSVDGLTIVDHGVGMPDGLSQPDGAAFNLSLTVENSGGSETNPTDYDYDLALFDADGTDITPMVTAFQPTDLEIAPRERETIALSGLFESDTESAPDDVARYEVSLSCSLASEGVYCDG